MRAGTAWIDITPDRPLHLLGQMHVRMGQYKRDPLTVNAVVFEDDSGHTRLRVAVVSIDVCVLPNALIQQLKAACAVGAAIDAEHVLIAATHTHVAPCTTDVLVGEPDPAFLAALQEAVVQSVARSIEDLEECTLYASAGYLEQMGWNRRGMRRDGSCHMYWGSWRAGYTGIEGPRDGEAGVIFARKPDGQVKVVITSFATHPNCVENESFYSADIPGEVRRVLRAALGEEVGIIYLTGAAANTAPSIMENNPQNIQPWRGEAGLVRSGLYLGGEIVKVIAAQVTPMVEPLLHHSYLDLKIPMREWDSGADLSLYQGGMLEFFEQSRASWPRLMAEANPVPTPIHVVRIGDAAICTNPAELYVEFGLAIKATSPARVTLIGQLTDGYCGYVPTPEAIRHGGYSATSASHTRLIPEGGWIMVEATRELLAQAFTKDATAQEKLHVCQE
jgi:neutral ceramidase